MADAPVPLLVEEGARTASIATPPTQFRLLTPPLSPPPHPPTTSAPQVSEEPGSEFGGFTRILHTGEPDDLMDEIPTVVVEKGPRPDPGAHTPYPSPATLSGYGRWRGAAVDRFGRVRARDGGENR